MFRILFIAIVSWIFFPTGLFREGLSWKGYSQDEHAPTWQKAMNLGAGIATAVACIAYLNSRQGEKLSPYGKLVDGNLENISVFDPIKSYLDFYTWLMPASIPEFLFSVGLLLCIPVLIILFFEIRIKHQRDRHHAYEQLPFTRISLHGKLMQKLSSDPTPEQEAKIGRKVNKATAHIKDPGPWKKRFAPITGPYRMGTNRLRYMVDGPVDVFVFIEGLITPAVTAAYSILFYIPTLLIVGLWLLLVVSFIIAIMPLAWLYGNGFRMRLH